MQGNYSRIDHIKQSITIEQAMAWFFPATELKRRGRRLWGCCPFHGERTPSFVVDTAKGRANCYGCGWNGDAIDLARAAGLSIGKLAADLGITGSSADRREWLQHVEGRRLEEAFRRRVDDAMIKLCSVMRATYAATKITSEADMEREGISEAFSLQVYANFLLDELAAKEPGRKYNALRAAEGLLYGQVT